MLRALAALALLLNVLAAHGAAAAEAEKAPGPAIEIVYVTRDYAEPLPLSLVEPLVTDKGVKGAQLGLQDNNAMGRFLGQSYRLREVVIPRATDFAERAREQLSQPAQLVVADLEPDDLLALADLAEARDDIILNVRSGQDELRGKSCRKNVFHVAPSLAMRTDALAQYLVWKQWKRWFLVRGEAPEDLEFAEAFKRSAKKFGGRIVEERPLNFAAGNRRTDTGHQQVQAQIPVLTQGAPEHDIVLVADTTEAFGEYLMWRTSAPKPVAGTHGLMTLAWHRSYEQNGGTQLQTRFEQFAKRRMTDRDYLAWLAVRSFGEAVSRSAATDATTIRAFLMSRAFALAAYKGQPLSFRSWDRQMRQPILLTGPLSLVSMSPQEGFLHQRHLTDTLGTDEPETACASPG